MSKMRKKQKQRLISVLLLLVATLLLAGFLIWFFLGSDGSSVFPFLKKGTPTAASSPDDGSEASNDTEAPAESISSTASAEETMPEEETSADISVEESSAISVMESETTAEPAMAPEQAETSGRVEELLAGMTLHEKICQLFIVFPSQITGYYPTVAAGDATRDALERYPVAGFLYDASNMESAEQLTEMLKNTQSYSKIPMIFTCDEEGGNVNRLMDTLGTTWVGPMLDYKDDGTEVARENAKTIATDMRSFGFNMDFAPVADVWSNRKIPSSGTAPTVMILRKRQSLWPPRWKASMKAALPARSSISPATAIPRPTATMALFTYTNRWMIFAKRSCSPSLQALRPVRTA